MSETRDARPGNAPRPPPTPPRVPTPRAPNPTTPQSPSPRPPAVSGAAANVQRTPAAGAVGPRRMPMHTQPGVGAGEPLPAPALVRGPDDSQPPADGGWDEADTATAIPEAAVTPVSPARQMPAVRDPDETAPQPAISMTNAMREEIWSIVRAAVQEAVGPVAAKHRELEERLERDRAERERAERERAERERLAPQIALGKPPPPAAGNPFTAAQIASIPVSMDPSIPPAPLEIPAQKAPPRLDGIDTPNVARLDTTPTAPRVMPAAKMPARVPGGSIPPTGYGVVVANAPSPSLDLPSSGGGPIDIPDFGRKRRIVGRVVVTLMLLAVVGAIVMTVLSHT